MQRPDVTLAVSGRAAPLHAPVPPQSAKVSRPQSAKSAASRLIHTPCIRPSPPPSRQSSSHVKSSSEVFRELVQKILSSRAARNEERSSFICDQPGVPTFSLAFHVPRNLDMRLYAHQALTNSRAGPCDERLQEPYDDPPLYSRRAHLHIPGRPTFRTSWRTPRCLDMRLDAYRNFSLGFHRDPYLGAPESLRQTREELQRKMDAAVEIAEYKTTPRPSTPRSVVQFFGAEEDFIAQDSQQQQAWKKQILNPPNGPRISPATAVARKHYTLSKRSDSIRTRPEIAASSSAQKSSSPQKHATRDRLPPPPVFEDPRDVHSWLAHQQWLMAAERARNA